MLKITNQSHLKYQTVNVKLLLNNFESSQESFYHHKNIIKEKALFTSLQLF